MQLQDRTRLVEAEMLIDAKILWLDRQKLLVFVDEPRVEFSSFDLVKRDDHSVDVVTDDIGGRELNKILLHGQQNSLLYHQ